MKNFKLSYFVKSILLFAIIIVIFQAGIVLAQTTPIGLWRLDEGSGSSATTFTTN